MSAFALDPLIAEAKQRARRRRLLALAAAGLLISGLLAFELASSGGGAGNGAAPPSAIPWLPTKPYLGPAHPPLAPPCTAAQLRGRASFMEAAGSASGYMSLVNRSSTACSLVGRPQLSFGGRTTTKWAISAAPDPSFHDPLAPPIGSLRALQPGGRVAVAMWWGAICAEPYPTRPPVLQDTALLKAPGGGTLRLGNLGLPPCNPPSGPGATPFVPVAAPTPALPLKVTILRDGPPPPARDDSIDGPVLVAPAGSWLSFTAVLTNRSAHVFRFGRSCPAYTEGVGGPGVWSHYDAYVLNCHGVGPIAPHASVRFAMRYHVPRSLDDFDLLQWTLAPHSSAPPGQLATLYTH
jgi:hypothetical protein